MKIVAILVAAILAFTPPTPTSTPAPASTPAADRYTGKWFGTWVQVSQSSAPVCLAYIKIRGEKVYPASGNCWIHVNRKS